MSSCLTPLVSTSRGSYFSPNQKVIALNGNKLYPYPAIFVRKVSESFSMIRWECNPKLEVRIRTSKIQSVESTSGRRSGSGRSSTRPTSDTPPIEYSAIKRQKLEFSNSPPQRVAKMRIQLPKRVAKVFGKNAQLYFGSAMEYNSGIWRVEYDDGDGEEYSETEMTQVLDLYKRKKHLDVEGGGNHGSGQNPSSEQASTGDESSSEEEVQVDHSPSDDDDDDAGPASPVSLAHSTRKREHDRTRGGGYSSADDSSLSSVHIRARVSNSAAVDSSFMDESGVRESGPGQNPSSEQASNGNESSSDTSDHSIPYSAADSSLSSVHIRARVSNSAAADSSSMGESGDDESGNEQQPGESDSITSMEDHSNDELQQLRERYIQRIKLFKSYSIEEFAREVQNDDISVGIEVTSDADSFVFGTQSPSDFHCLNSTESFHFQRAVPNVRPFSVRPAIKKTRWFKPSYCGGKTPTLPSKLHKFPSFSAGSVKFKGAVTGYLSIHLLEETKLGTRCSPEVTNTWNAANSLALTHYPESSVMNEPEWKCAMDDYKNNLANQNYTFTGGAADKEMSFPDIKGILHLRIVYDMLGKIERDSHGGNSAGGDPRSARSLLNNSFILLQAPGFKKQWGMMQSAYDQQIPEVEEVFQVENYEHDYAGWNQKLKAMTTATYQRAEAFFIKLPLVERHDESALYAIDIALKFRSTDAKWDVLLSGKVAEETVVATTKLRRAELREVDEESSEHDESSSESELSDSDATPLSPWNQNEEDSQFSWRPDQERANNNDPESQREDQVADNDDDPISELLELIDMHGWDGSHNNPNESSGQVLQVPEVHDMHATDLLESAAVLHSGGMNRIRYPTFGTTGIAFGNAQSKPGINLLAARDHGAVYVSHPKISEDKLRSVSLAQLYQPYQRFGMGVQTMVKTRLEARKLPKMIAEYASEFETLLVDDSSTKKGEKAFALIKGIFFVIKNYLAGLKVHPLFVRYELTFVTDMNNHMAILPPINDNTSPFKCVRLAKKADMFDSILKLIDMHKDVIQGFCRLEDFPNLSTSMDANQWTAIIASTEAVVNFIGMGGGAKGSILKQSLDTEPAFFFEHYWMAHPKFITLLPPRADNINQGGTDSIRFGVDSNLLAFATPQGAIEDEAPNITILRSLDYVDGTLSMYLIEGLPKLDEPAPFRKCMLLIYTALLAAGKEAGNLEEVVTIFDRIQWTGVGLQVASVNYVFKEIAAALVALYKVEWANRNTKFIEKKLRLVHSEEGKRKAANFRKNRKQFVLDLRDSHTKSELGTLILNRMGNVWPFDLSPFDSRDNNSSKMTQAGRAT
jgi:hypothetical protein